MNPTSKPRVAFGPVMWGWGSWEWLGADLSSALENRFDVWRFDAWEVPSVDLVVFVKHAPPFEILERLSGTAVIYCPVDSYGAVREIAADASFLRRCDRVIVHCTRLLQFFEPYTETLYLDHHLKYVGDAGDFRPAGPVLWCGVRSNLPAVVRWVDEHGPPGELWILTNPENPEQAAPEAFGFKPGTVARLETRSPERHCEWAAVAGAAFDVKDETFRSRHKPPAKPFDFVASGLPFAMNADASAVEHLAGFGLAVPAPSDGARWRSRDYWDETQRFKTRLREELTLDNIAARLAAVIEEVLAERGWGQEPNVAAKRLRNAIDCAALGAIPEATAALNELAGDSKTPTRVANDLGVLEAIQGRVEDARSHFNTALNADEPHSLARENAALINAAAENTSQRESTAASSKLGQPSGKPRVALASFLFNWPSTGGGIVHTIELGKFLQAAGYDVHHFFARKLDFGIGCVADRLPYEATAIDFADHEWNREAIQSSFRAAVARFAPTRVVVTDAWNTKPLLADALKEWPYLLRFQALECLCPLNNIRLLPGPTGGVRQCTLNQLDSPDECLDCVARLGGRAGGLHQIERGVSGYGTAEYDQMLRAVLRNAHAVLAVNPLMGEILAPHSSRVVVCPAGMDPARFPSPCDTLERPDGLKRILFAGLAEEFIKGYHFLREAAAHLWQQRRDFRIVVTGDPLASPAPFEEFVGWQRQEDLPRAMADVDVVAAPAIAQEAIGRTAVEGMAAGRAVLASRIGGLPFALDDGAAGLLFEPGDLRDLVAKLHLILDDGELRRRLGHAGRRRFEERFAWPGIIERQYKPLIEDEPVGGRRQ